jgi:hypothetical protein
MEDLEKEAWSSIFWNSFKDGHMTDKEFTYLMNINKGVDVGKEVDTHLLNNPEYDSLALNTKLRQLMQTFEIHKEICRANKFIEKFETLFCDRSIDGDGCCNTCQKCIIFYTGGCKECLKKYLSYKLDEKVRKRVLAIQKDAEASMRDFMYLATSNDLPVSKEKERKPRKGKVDK